MGDYQFRLVMAFMAVLFFLMFGITFMAFQQKRYIEMACIFGVFIIVATMFMRSYSRVS